MPRVLAILGSARTAGHTAALMDAVIAERPVTRLDLCELSLGHYEYGRPYDRDDFGAVTAALLAHDAVLLATPVYWYAMSARLKVLFDRLTDLATVRKDLGRQLRGRGMFVAVSGSEQMPPEGFEVPFRDTAGYFDMHYGGSFYAPAPGAGDLPDATRQEAAAFGTAMFKFQRASTLP